MTENEITRIFLKRIDRAVAFFRGKLEDPGHVFSSSPTVNTPTGRVVFTQHPDVYQKPEMHDPNTEIRTISDGLDLVERNRERLADGLTEMLLELADERLIPDNPPGFRPEALRRAAERFPVLSSFEACPVEDQADTVLASLLITTRDLPEGEIWGKMADYVSGLFLDVTLGEVREWVRHQHGADSWLLPHLTPHRPGRDSDTFLAPLSVLARPIAAVYRAVCDLAIWHHPRQDPYLDRQDRVIRDLARERTGGDTEATDRLVDAVRKRLEDIRRAVGYPELAGGRPETDADGMLPADKALFDVLTDAGGNGWGEAIEKRREAARGRWVKGASGADLFELWWERDGDKKEPWFAKNLVKATWEGEVKPRLEREQKYPCLGIPAAIFDPFYHCFGAPLDKCKESKDGDDIVLTTEYNEIIRIAPSTIAPFVCHKVLESTRSILGFRIILRLFQYMFENFLDGNQRPGEIIIPGGYTGICERVAMNPRKYAQHAQEILFALGNIPFEFKLPKGNVKGSSVLHCYCLRDGKNHYLKVTVADPFVPGSGAWFKGAPAEVSALVPMSAPEMLPTVGRLNDQVGQASFYLLVLREFALLAPMLVDRGGVEIPRRRIGELYDEAGLSTKAGGSFFDRLVNGAGTASSLQLFPAFQVVGKDTYKLGPGYKREEALLVRQGKYRLGQSKRGSRGATATHGRVKG